MRTLCSAALFMIVFSHVATADNTENGIENVLLAEQLKCLALNVYHEARSEPNSGKVAVGYVVLNRMADKRFPDTICGVVEQGGELRKYRCQFSWWCDGKSDTPKETQAWQESINFAQQILNGKLKDPTSGAKWYHADYVDPTWAHRLVKTAQLGHHIFYTDPPQLVSK